MSVDYSAVVFYGACVPRESELGRKLERYIDEHEGTPAPTGVKNIEVSRVGSDYEGWLTVQIKGSDMRFGRHQEIQPPALLLEQNIWPMWIGEFLVVHEAVAPADLPQIGWHFAGCAS